MAELTSSIKLSREEAEGLLADACTKFLTDADDLSYSVVWNYTEHGDLDSVVVSVYESDLQQS